MAELADATVSNTVGEILTGSIPVPGTHPTHYEAVAMAAASHLFLCRGVFFA